mgnify:CR=1 FL=1
MSEFEYLKDKAWLHDIAMGKDDKNALLLEIAYQLKRIGDLLEEKN